MTQTTTPRTVTASVITSEGWTRGYFHLTGPVRPVRRARTDDPRTPAKARLFYDDGLVPSSVVVWADTVRDLSPKNAALLAVYEAMVATGYIQPSA